MNTMNNNTVAACTFALAAIAIALIALLARFVRTKMKLSIVTSQKKVRLPVDFSWIVSLLN